MTGKPKPDSGIGAAETGGAILAVSDAPDGSYTRGPDSSMTGPNKGRSTSTGKFDENGEEIFKRDSGGYYIVDENGIQRSVKSPFENNSNIGARKAHHDAKVTEVKAELESEGYTVADGEASFSYACGQEGRCRPDIIAKDPKGRYIIIEVKTGNADLSIRQSDIYPQIENGDAIPTGQVADRFGLRPGMPLKEQGYPNGIPIEIRQFEGLQND